jgi:hypothetical protein
MADRTLYRIALEYTVAERLAEQLPPDYADGTPINSLADDRFLITEPDLVLFPTVAVPPDIDQVTLESRLSPVNLAEKPVEIGVARGQIKQYGEETHVLVTLRPAFDIGALQAEMAEYIRGVNGEIVSETIPHITRRDIPEAYITVQDISSPAAARKRRGVVGRVRSHLAALFRPEGTALLPSGIVSTHTSVQAETPHLTLSEVPSPPTAAILT